MFIQIIVVKDRVLANPRATARVPTAPLHHPRPYYEHDSCENMVQLWRICAVFFYFSLAPWSGTAPQGGAEQIARNCGAFAPYFFYFSLISKVENVLGVSPLHYTG